MSQGLFILTALIMLLVGVGFIVVLKNEISTATGKLGIVFSSLLVGVSLILLFMSSKISAVSVQKDPGLVDETMEVQAEDFRFWKVSDEAEMNLSSLKGQVVLLNFWATWCGPCLFEMPELNRLQDTYRNFGLTVLNVSDEPRADVLAFEKDAPLHTLSTFIIDPLALPVRYQEIIDVRPVTYIIDRKGVIRRHMVGRRNFAFFEKAIKPLL